MNRFFLYLYLSFSLPLLTLTLNCVSRKSPKQNAVSLQESSLEGTYLLTDPKTERPVTSMIITNYNGSTFLVRGIGQSWEGSGEFKAGVGHYDWRFTDGRLGRTELSLNAEGKLLGRVVEKINGQQKFVWEYLGTKSSKSNLL